jgi:hypothetical protein
VNKVTTYLLNTTSVIWYLTIALLLAAGWATRDQNYVVAESGIGYWLGIIGGSLMLLLLIYPMRKRFRRWSVIGSVKSWFRLHMILGIVGPLMIIFHSGFKLGSFNSSVAFFCMLIVASSGLLGRYLYQRIHLGLYGRKLQFEEFYSDNELTRLLLRRSEAIQPVFADEFEQIEKDLTQQQAGIDRSIGFYRKMRARIDRLHRSVRQSELQQREKKHVLLRLKDLRSICALGINEILFSYWHILHMPLFIMLILSGLIHVAVVHLY